MTPARSALFLSMVLVITGCGRADVLAVESPRPARAPEAVALLLDVPDRPYRTLALIRSPSRNLFRGMDRLTEEVRAVAAELGADAVILSLSSHEAADATVVGSDGQVVIAGGSDSLRVVGRAIVYTDQ